MVDGMWFGPRGYMQWIACPDIDANTSKIGWSSKVQYLNGGAGVRNSTASHKEYAFSWNLISRDEGRQIIDFADGVYNPTSSLTLMYFHDPMTLDRNVLPQLWASPAQSTVDGLTLFPGQTATAVQTPTNTLGYPARSAVYRANSSSNTLWVPIPPGYTAWVGAHGSATGTAGMTVATTLGAVTNTPTTLSLLSVTDSTRFNFTVDASSSVDGIQLGFVNNGPSSTDTVTLSGVMVQLIPTGFSPATVGGFISGQGHSGCQFDGMPTQTPHSLAFDLVAISAGLVETGSWL